MNLPHGFPKPLLMFAFAFVLPFAGSGCGKQACFFWTEAEGACPSQDEAIDFFGDPNCDSAVESVDSEGEFDGELCCYDVTERDTGDILCSGPVGAGGFGSGVAVSTSGGTGGSSCQSCSSFITAAFMGASPAGLCSGSAAIFASLSACLCSGVCQPDCSTDFACMGSSQTSTCFNCATDSAVGCGSQFTACTEDL